LVGQVPDGTHFGNGIRKHIIHRVAQGGNGSRDGLNRIQDIVTIALGLKVAVAVHIVGIRGVGVTLRIYVCFVVILDMVRLVGLLVIVVVVQQVDIGVDVDGFLVVDTGVMYMFLLGIFQEHGRVHGNRDHIHRL